MLHAREFALAGALVAGHLLGISAVEVGAEGGDLDHLVLAPAAVDHVHDAKAPADDEGAPEQTLDLLGRGAGGDVEVLGPQAQQQVAHAAADEVGLEAGLLERVHHVQRALVHQLGVDVVHAGRHVFALAETRARAGAAGLAQQLVDEFLDHSKRFRMRQPRCLARVARRSSGLVATGSSTFSSSGRSFIESL